MVLKTASHKNSLYPKFCAEHYTKNITCQIWHRNWPVCLNQRFRLRKSPLKISATRSKKKEVSMVTHKNLAVIGRMTQRKNGAWIFEVLNLTQIWLLQSIMIYRLCYKPLDIDVRLRTQWIILARLISSIPPWEYVYWRKKIIDDELVPSL